MATGKKELTVLLVMVAMAMVVMSSMVAGVAGIAAAPSFPLECSQFMFGQDQPGRFCCIDVQDQFLLKKLKDNKTVGIGGFCKAVTKAGLSSGPLKGKDLDLALSIPDRCQLSDYYKKGYKCAGKIIPGGI